MIKLKMHQHKWRIKIGERCRDDCGEEWEFETKKEFEENLKKLIEIKDKYGKVVY